jgi:hypothetical protein
MSKNLFLLLILINIIYSPIQAQSYNPQQIELAERLQALAFKATPELAYIQTSKDIYETGEDLWFKVYLLNSQTLIPSLLSKTLYLQLINEDGKKAIWQEKYEIQNGFANGRIYLETDLPEGEYLLEAFTSNSFFDDSSEFKAVRRIKIKTDITSLSITPKLNRPYYSPNDSIKIIFNPSFKPRDSSTVEITVILYKGNTKIASAQTKTNKNGNAIIAFNPQRLVKDLKAAINIKYKDRSESLDLTIPSKNNPIQFTTFPEGGNLILGLQNKLAFKAVNALGNPIEVAGTLFEDSIPLLNFKSFHAGMGSLEFRPLLNKKYTIRLNNQVSDSIFSLPEICPSGVVLKLIEKDKEFLYLKVIQSRDLGPEEIYLRVQCRGIVYGMTTAKLDKELRIKVPLSGLPQGIAEITLFNSSLIPVAERLVYVNKDRKLIITTQLSKDILPTRGKAILKISVRDEQGLPVMSNLGVSVFDKIYQNLNDSNNILVHYYLSTQLMGKIYNPSFYFSKRKDADDALDILMLTQGWRKYLWSESNLENFRYGNQQLIDGIRGQITTTKRIGKKIQEDGFAFAFSVENQSVLIPTDSAGIFIVSTELMKRWENNYIYFKPVSSQYSIANVKIYDPFESINRLINLKEISYPLQVFSEEIEVPLEIYTNKANTYKIKSIIIKGKSSNANRGKYLGELDSLKKLFNSDDDWVCRNNVLNCPNHGPNEMGTTKPVNGRRYKTYSDGTWHQVEYRSTNPITASSEEELLKLNKLSRIKAYYGDRTFYKPNYDKDTIEANVPDFRNTLLWEPSIFTDEKGEATLSFFCSDIYTDFIGRIEGVGGNGLLGSQNFYFKVRKLSLRP